MARRYQLTMIKCAQNRPQCGLPQHYRTSMRQSGLHNNTERRKYWEWLSREKSAEELDQALNAIHPTSAQVLCWHYRDGHSLEAIQGLLGRSISIVRNQHNRRLFELQRYFHRQQTAR